ncbi:hypothetical protein G9A89_011086 [Geosiphon pyriformis]|nr:hypothetical protein G9A89_011086 [Geosiphon pyriformis]
MKPTLVVSMELNNKFAILECRVDIVMSKSSDVITGSETIVGVAVVNSSVISKMEETLNNLSITVMGLLAKIDNTGLFDGVRIFSSGLDKRFFGTGVAIIINNSLAHYVFKVEEIPGYLVSVQLLFKNKLLIVFLGLYTGASAETKFGQACEINTLIAKAANSSMFIVLGSDFNEDGYKKSTSFGFGIKNADANKWAQFREHSLAKFLKYIDVFNEAKVTKNLDAIKVVSKACTMFDNSESRESILLHLLGVKKLYQKSKYYGSKVARNSSIRKAIDKSMETFSFNKGHMIKSVLDWLFKKVVLDHLVVDEVLILEPKEVKSAVNSIMKE